MDAPVIERGERVMTKEELENVSGYRSPSRQVEWVRSQLGITPAVRADGRPSLTWTAYERALLQSRATGPQRQDSYADDEAPPNWNRPRR